MALATLIENDHEGRGEIVGLDELAAATRVFKQFVRQARPERCSGDQARQAVALLAEGERAASSGIALFSPVVAETGAHTKEGHGSAGSWLASLTGSSTGAANGRLADAQRAADTPELAKALHQGELSAQQIKLLSKAAATDPSSAGELLSKLSSGSSNEELSDEVARQRAAARSRESERVRRDRVHAIRHLRWSQAEGGGIRVEGLCDDVAWAKVQGPLEAEAQRRWKAAGSDSQDDLAAHRMDALLDLLAGKRSRAGESARSRDPSCVVLIDAEALRRGTTSPGEICEIDGIGPISVDAATELLCEGSAQFMLRSAKSICSVTGRSRHVAQRLAMTLVARDRKCAVPGCGQTKHLQSDHRIEDFAKGGLTELSNLARLCPSHHDLKTHGGWKLEGHPGQWKWVAPDNPPSAGAISRARRLAAAKAKAKINRPRRT
ncbi:MAG TPA: HNH endonuclease signature motif containing protein [Acidimicrobiales bacterium]